VNVIADTNVLIRAALFDDADQGQASRAILASAERIVVSRHALCEMVWVLKSRYKMARKDILNAVTSLVDAENVVVDRSAIDAGLQAMNSGADFADGVIAYEGRWLGGDTFVSFDKKAVAAMKRQGLATRLVK